MIQGQLLFNFVHFHVGRAVQQNPVSTLLESLGLCSTNQNSHLDVGVVATVGTLPGADSIEPPDQLATEVAPRGVVGPHLGHHCSLSSQVTYFNPVVTSASALLLPRFNEVDHLDGLAQAGGGGQAAGAEHRRDDVRLQEVQPSQLETPDAL